MVTKDDEVLERISLNRLSQVVLVGRVGATTPALLALLDADVGLSMVGRGGRLRGRLMPPLARNAPLRRAQYRTEQDDAFCLEFARAGVHGKLCNSRTMLRRLRRRRDDLPEWGVVRVQEALKRTKTAKTLAELRGVEGGAARAYFAILRLAVRPEMHFDKRTRRPPTDPTNAMMGLGYTLLTSALMSALEIVGLDPYIGFYHADKYARPSLALDLTEEFRTPVVDSLVLMLINKRMVGPEDFEPGPKKAVYLNRHGRRVFFREFADS